MQAPFSPLSLGSPVHPVPESPLTGGGGGGDGDEGGTGEGEGAGWDLEADSGVDWGVTQSEPSALAFKSFPSLA